MNRLFLLCTFIVIGLLIIRIWISAVLVAKQSQFIISLKSYGYPVNVTSASHTECNLEVIPPGFILWSNKFWQEQKDLDGHLFLYSSFKDVGKRVTYVRIFAMSEKRLEDNLKIFCYLWPDNKYLPNVVVADIHHIWIDAWDKRSKFHSPYMFSCRLDPNDPKNYTHVSVAFNKCSQLTNSLKIISEVNSSKKSQFAVCLKGLDFAEDISERLIEWIELHRILGARKILIYKFHVHSNVTKILDFYEAEGFVDIYPITLPGKQPNAWKERTAYLKNDSPHKRRHEILFYNDCLYRLKNIYKYVVLVDVDEVIVPVNSSTWYELMKTVRTEIESSNKTVIAHKGPMTIKWKVKKYASYYASNIYYLDDHVDNSSHLYFLQRNIRNESFLRKGYGVKSFFDTDGVVTLYNHQVIKWEPNYGQTYHIPYSLARLHHYKPSNIISNHVPVEDTLLHKYKQKLTSRTEKGVETTWTLVTPVGCYSELLY